MGMHLLLLMVTSYVAVCGAAVGTPSDLLVDLKPSGYFFFFSSPLLFSFLILYLNTIDMHKELNLSFLSLDGHCILLIKVWISSHLNQ